jgi:hypothetical protein
MKPPRETVYAALANLVFTHPEIVANFKTTGRFLRHHQQLPGGGGDMPAIYLNQFPGETQERRGKGMEPKRTLRCHFVMYFNDSTATDPTTLPATLCNIGLDAIDDVINIPANTVSNVQNLGIPGVEHVYIEGPISIAEGLLQEDSIVLVPITILLP